MFRVFTAFFTHQLLVYVDKNISTIKSVETVLQVSREVGLEVNTEKTKNTVCFATRMWDGIIIY
jgi:hypothetical protein